MTAPTLLSCGANLPNISEAELDIPDLAKLAASRPATHPPRILLLYGSLRERSYSRFLTLEAERLLKHFGAETRVYDGTGVGPVWIRWASVRIQDPRT